MTQREQAPSVRTDSLRLDEGSVRVHGLPSSVSHPFHGGIQLSLPFALLHGFSTRGGSWLGLKTGLACQAPTSRGVQAKAGGRQAQAGVGGDAMLYPFDDLLEMKGIVDEVKKQTVDRQDGAFGVF